MRKFTLAVAAALTFVAHHAEAQSVGKLFVDDMKHVGGDIIGIWTSPFRASQRDWLLVAATGGAFGVSMLADQSVSDWAIRNREGSFFDALEPVRSGGAVYTGKNIVPPIAVVYVAGLAFKNQGMRDFVTGCASAWLSQSVLRKGAYLAVGRERPDTSPDNPQRWEFPGDRGDWQKHSFPAGHFANAMSCATFWAERFEMGWWGAPVYAVAGAIGIGRMADGGHWTSDTVLGGILGYAVGREIARRSLARNEHRVQEKRTAELFVSPERGRTYVGFNVKY